MLSFCFQIALLFHLFVYRKLVLLKLEKGYSFGDAILDNVNTQDIQSSHPKEKTPESVISTILGFCIGSEGLLWTHILPGAKLPLCSILSFAPRLFLRMVENSFIRWNFQTVPTTTAHTTVSTF